MDEVSEAIGHDIVESVMRCYADRLIRWIQEERYRAMELGYDLDTVVVTREQFLALGAPVLICGVRVLPEQGVAVRKEVERDELRERVRELEELLRRADARNLKIDVAGVGLRGEIERLNTVVAEHVDVRRVLWEENKRLRAGIQRIANSILIDCGIGTPGRKELLELVEEKNAEL